MKHFAVIGYPVGHSLGPQLHSRLFELLGLEADYQRVAVKPGQLAGIIEQLRAGAWAGLNVTRPHKVAVRSYCDRQHDTAQETRSVNCLAPSPDALVGYNTDYEGFQELLSRNHIDLTRKDCVLFGAGGVARTVIRVLIHNRARSVLVQNRSPEKAAELIRDCRGRQGFTKLTVASCGTDNRILQEKTVLINCTSVGMDPGREHSPVSREHITAGQTLIDIIYTPRETRFLALGRAAGARTVNGIDMFICQGLKSLQCWFPEVQMDRLDYQALKKYVEDQIPC